MSYFSNIHDMIEFIGILCFVFLLGSFSTLTIAAYFFHKYLSFSSILYEKSSSKYKSVQFSNLLKENLNTTSQDFHSTESCRFVNILLAFVFKEWRDTAAVQRWILKKVNVEIKELLETKAAKRLIHAIKINDINLGTSSPVIHGITIKEPRAFSNDILPERVVIDVDFEYEGGFYLSVDADLLFGKSASVSILIKHMKGQIRVQLSRHPCTHWSVSFVDEPTLDIMIDTNFLSRPLPQLGSLIMNQVYRTVRRKHTFPRYKIRYTPINAFWVDHCGLDEIDDARIDLRRIEVTILSCTRLLLPHSIDKRKDRGSCGVVFVTVSIDDVSCEGFEPVRSDPSDSKKSNFLLTSIADALSEVDESLGEKYPIEAPETSAPPMETSAPPIDSSAPPIEPSVPLHAPHSEEPARDDNNNNRKEAETEGTTEGRSDATTTGNGERVGTSYMMVTRNFTAILSEHTSMKAGNPLSVHVGSIMWSKNVGVKATISEGDRILSINGRAVNSLSQAIAVINEIRSQKARFYFKVQRNRRQPRATSLFRQEKEPDKIRTRSMPTPSRNPFEDLPSSDEDEPPPIEDDTESDFSHVDTDDQESYINEGSFQRRKKVNSLLTPNHSSSKPLQGTSRSADDVSASVDDDLKFAQVSSSRVFKTGLCTSHQTDYSWPNDSFLLDVEDQHKYLNVRFWYQEIATTSPVKNANLTLVGVVAVPLQTLHRHCRAMTSGNFTRRYKVLSPLATDSDLRRNAERLFRQRSGFKLEHCYGDVTINTRRVT